MAEILDRILEKKRQEIRTLKEIFLKENDNRMTRPFKPLFENTSQVSIIAEFKRASPSKGVINGSLNPVEQALQYEKYGASAISVLTDQSFFSGSFQDLHDVSKAVSIPVLCKDFLIDPIQIDIAAAYGADIVLLIAAALQKTELKKMYKYAKQQGLEVLVEVHNEAELDSALAAGAKLIGVNNRNLQTFEVNLEVTEKLAEAITSSGAFLVSESGIRDRFDVERVIKAGAKGILVGETMMVSGNIPETMKELHLPLNSGVSL